MIKFHNVEQQSDEWFKLRLDFPFTSSHAQAIGTGGKGMKTLVENKIAEKYSSAERVEYQNEDLDRGNELEYYARKFFILKTGLDIKEVGFVTNSKYPMAGSSPDGLIDDSGLEIKCQNDRKHFMSIVNGSPIIESQYHWQMQDQMLKCGLKRVYFALYNPNFKESLLIQEVTKKTVFKAGREEINGEEAQKRLVKNLKKAFEYYQELEKKYNSLKK